MQQDGRTIIGPVRPLLRDFASFRSLLRERENKNGCRTGSTSFIRVISSRAVNVSLETKRVALGVFPRRQVRWRICWFVFFSSEAPNSFGASIRRTVVSCTGNHFLKKKVSTLTYKCLLLSFHCIWGSTGLTRFYQFLLNTRQIPASATT